MLVAQQRLTPATTILVTPWQGARQPPRQVTDRKGPGPPAALPAGGLVFLPGIGTSPPAGGRARPGECYIVGPWLPWPAGSSQDAQTVRNGPPMQRAGPGDDEAPSGQLGHAEPPSAGKAAARPAGARGKDVGGVRPPGLPGGGPDSCQRSRGAPGPMRAADRPTLPAPAARGWGGPWSRAPPYLGSPHQQRKASRTIDRG